MITAKNLTMLTTMSAGMLTTKIQETGYTQDKFVSATFVGITNAGLFCYRCEYKDTFDGSLVACSVFLTYDPTTDRVTADY